MQDLPQTERQSRFAAAARALDAYGGDVARWPEALYSLYAELSGDPEFEAMRADALSLDALLAAAASAPDAGEALKQRILAGFPAKRAPARMSGGGAFASLFDLLRGRPAMAPAGALAGLAAIGFSLGVTSAGMASQQEAYAFAQAALAAVEDVEPYWGEEW